MDPAETSEARECRSDNATHRKSLETSDQATSRTESMANNQGFRGTGTGDLEREESALKDERFKASLLENSQAEDFPTPDAPTGHQSMLGGLAGVKDMSLHEAQRRPEMLLNLGEDAYQQFQRTNHIEDVDRAIEYWRKAATLVGNSRVELRVALNKLGCAYGSRFHRLGDPSDLKTAIGFGEKAVSLSADGHPDKPAYLSNVGNLYSDRFEQLCDPLDLNEAIKLGGEAVSLTPDDHPDKPAYLNNLGVSYRTRFECWGDLSDLNEAIKFKRRAVLLAPDGNHEKAMYLSSLGVSYQTRFEHLGESSELNAAIEFNAQAVSLTFDNHPEKPMYLSSLGDSYKTRFQRLGEPSDLDKAIELNEQAVLFAPDDHPNKSAYLNNLGNLYVTRFELLGELSDLNKAIEFQAQAISLTPDGHLEKPACLHSLGISYSIRFGRLKEPLDLNTAIGLNTQAVSLTPGGHPDKAQRLSDLGIAYAMRFKNFADLSDLWSAESLLMKASQSPTAPPSVRFTACRQWAKVSLLDLGLSPFPAYRLAMSLIPQLIWIGTTVGRRHELVAEVSKFATEAASYAISTGSYDLALEWLEAGRSIVWGQIAQLRTPFDDLSKHSPKLAEVLAAIGRRLEHAGSRSSSSSCSEASGLGLSEEANYHVELALEWDRMLGDIRLMPGFEDFLKSPTADQLLSAAKTHPVAIINLYRSRCDALILQPGSDTISHVALTNFSFKDATSAQRDVLSQVRYRKPGSLNPQRSLHKSLEDLWTGVVRPVLDFLGYTRQSPVDQLPRLTWCTTGPLSFLPLHTARSHDPTQLSAFDLVISSYAPTLSALLSRHSANSSPMTGILAVGQENTPGLNPLPCTATELAVIHKHTQSEYYLQLESDEATIETVLDAMDQFNWVHMACHGSQDAENPMQSAFHLHDGNLTLAAITERSFTNKGLAFLSACQTATGDKNMPDEAVHLAAGMLMAGYPSVIGTMWSIADEDGPEVADLVYAELLRDGKMDHTRSASALHRAIAQLRAKVGEENIARWAPFIHIGC